jgi:hypothetical protein
MPNGDKHTSLFRHTKKGFIAFALGPWFGMNIKKSNQEIPLFLSWLGPF